MGNKLNFKVYVNTSCLEEKAVQDYLDVFKEEINSKNIEDVKCEFIPSLDFENSVYKSNIFKLERLSLDGLSEEEVKAAKDKTQQINTCISRLFPIADRENYTYEDNPYKTVNDFFDQNADGKRLGCGIVQNHAGCFGVHFYLAGEFTPFAFILQESDLKKRMEGIRFHVRN